MATLHEQRTERSGLGSWSRTRWVIVGLVLAAIVVAVLLVVYMGGGGGGGNGGGGY
ncbi:MAG TPA: hypothetical protein VKB10_01370 [Gaiellaceae bacterium]|nr:hypothetical protein [Gaiellaceae bacterium]